MGIDGFSLSNLGLNRNMTSSQLATEAERTARQSLDNQMADVDGVGKKEKAGRKDPDAAFNGMVPFIPADKEEEEQPQDSQDETASQNNSQETYDSDDDDDEYASRYHFRFNSNDMIEVFDTEKSEVVRTISPENASKAIKDMTKIPGVFINKKV